MHRREQCLGKSCTSKPVPGNVFFPEYLLLPSPRCCPLLHWSCPARTKFWSLTVTIVVHQGSCLHLWTTSLASLPHIASDIIISSSSISSDSCLILWTSDSLKVLCLGWPAQRAHTRTSIRTDKTVDRWLRRGGCLTVPSPC